MKSLAVFVAALVSTAALAAPLSGKRLHQLANSSDRGEQAYALGYVSGAVDVLDQSVACVPSTVSKGNILLRVVQLIERSPDEANEPADTFVFAVVSKGWSCRLPSKTNQSLI